MDKFELTESKLFQRISEILQKNSAKLSTKYESKDMNLSKTIGRSSKKISKETFAKVLKYFENEVLPFAESLEKYQQKLTMTLDFDLHEILTAVLSESKKIVKSGDSLVEKLPKSTAEATKKMFRYILWPWIKTSYFVSRGLLKPRGYPGDYIIVEQMYDGNTKSLGLGYIYDTIFLQTQLCQGLRNRKDHMKQILSNFICQRSKDKITVFNLACGGSRELREIPVSDAGNGIKLYLMDFDQKALDFSITKLRSKMSKAKISPLNMDVRKLINEQAFKNVEIDQCDLIYSIGLFDYLPDRVIMRLLRNLVVLLKHNGFLIFAHKDYTLYHPRIADWFCDWRYYHRTQKDFEEKLKELGVNVSNVSFPREKDGYIFFVEINKSSLTSNQLKNT